MKIDLSGKYAVVCGSTRGIGKAIAMQFAECGASVVLVARNEDSLREVLRLLRAERNQNHNFIVADFSDPESLKMKMKNFVSESKPVHILVNNTGGPKGGDIAKAETSEFESAFKNHLICNQIMAQAVIEGMKKEKFGRIINIISTSVRVPIKGLGVSNTIRAAVAAWAKTLATEVAQYGITVNNILPGATKTDRLNSLIKAMSVEKKISEEEASQKWLGEIPACRFGEPEEPAYAAAFLASPLASYINGISLPVDGGRIQSL